MCFLYFQIFWAFNDIKTTPIQQNEFNIHYSRIHEKKFLKTV